MSTGKETADRTPDRAALEDSITKVDRQVKELKSFRRITLQVGETQTVEFVLGRDQLAFFDEHMKRTVEPGIFDVMVGTNSIEVQSVQLEVAK